MYNSVHLALRTYLDEKSRGRRTGALSRAREMSQASSIPTHTLSLSLSLSLSPSPSVLCPDRDPVCLQFASSHSFTFVLFQGIPLRQRMKETNNIDNVGALRITRKYLARVIERPLALGARSAPIIEYSDNGGSINGAAPFCAA